MRILDIILTSLIPRVVHTLGTRVEVGPGTPNIEDSVSRTYEHSSQSGKGKRVVDSSRKDPKKHLDGAIIRWTIIFSNVNSINVPRRRGGSPDSTHSPFPTLLGSGCPSTIIFGRQTYTVFLLLGRAPDSSRPCSPSSPRPPLLTRFQGDVRHPTVPY